MRARLLTVVIHVWTAFALSLPQSARLVSNLSLNSTFVPSLNTSSIAATSSECFFDPRLVPPTYLDCIHAARALIGEVAQPFRVKWFARKGNAGFQLPKTVGSGTCVISLDVVDDDDRDHFQPWDLYTAALTLADTCVTGDHGLGGTRIVGPGKVVGLIMFGREQPAINDEENAGEGKLLSISRARSVTNGEGNAGTLEAQNTSPSELMDQPLNTDSDDEHAVVRRHEVGETPRLSDNSQISSDLTTLEPSVEISVSDGRPMSYIRSLGDAITCYDPPLPRERLYTYDSSDCDSATDQIIGNRNKWQKYIFSRKPSTSPFHYQLPARFANKSCVVVLDMANDKDEDEVRVTFVASSAWVLAHKCSGEEEPTYRYGGFMKVSVEAKHLIGVYVYGRPWPPGTGQDPMITLPQNVSSVDTQ